MTTPVRFPSARRSEPFTGQLVSVFADHAEPRDPSSNRIGLAGYGLNGQCVALPGGCATWICVGATDNERKRPANTRWCALKAVDC
jgi:hypothetical protein